MAAKKKKIDDTSQSLLDSEAAVLLAELIVLARDTSVKADTRVKAITYVLDRAWGKAPVEETDAGQGAGEQWRGLVDALTQPSAKKNKSAKAGDA